MGDIEKANSPVFPCISKRVLYSNSILKRIITLVWSIALFAVTAVILLGLIVLLFIYASSTDPDFTLHDITISSFNVSTTEPYLLSTNIHVIVSARNTAAYLADIIYEDMNLYANYGGHENITLRNSLIPVSTTYQRHNAFMTWSTNLEGRNMVIPPLSERALMEDLNSDKVALLIVIQGRVKFIRVGQEKITEIHRLSDSCWVKMQLVDMKIENPFTVVTFQSVQDREFGLN